MKHLNIIDFSLGNIVITLFLNAINSRFVQPVLGFQQDQLQKILEFGMLKNPVPEYCASSDTFHSN